MPLPSSFEPIGSRVWQGLTHRRIYRFPSTIDTLVARNSVLLSAPTAYENFVRNDETLRVYQDSDGTVVAEVDYFHPSIEPANTSPLRTPEDPAQASFDTTGATQRIYQSLKTIQKLYVSDFNDGDLDFKGTLNVTSDGHPQGIDVPVPKLALSYRKLFAKASVTNTYIRKLSELTATTNDATFYGYARGELLFLGARGQTQGEYTSIEFLFDAGFNKTGLHVEGFGESKVFDKKAHEHMWVYHDHVLSPTDKDLIVNPRALFVEQIFPESDFSNLGIGTS